MRKQFSILLCCLMTTVFAQAQTVAIPQHTQSVADKVTAVAADNESESATNAKSVAQLSAETAEAEMAALLKKHDTRAAAEEKVTYVDAKRELMLNLRDDHFKVGDVKSSTKKAPATKANASYKTGTLVAIQKSYFGEDGNRSDRLELIEQDGQTYVVNIYGMGDTTLININVEAGTVSIPASVIYVHSTYGNVICCPCNMAQHTYNPSGNITGTIDAEGRISLNEWGVFVGPDQTNSGSAFNVFSESTWIPTNGYLAGMKSTNELTSYDVYVEQTAENQVAIYNIGNYGSCVYGTLTSDKKLKIEPQQLYYNAFYGPFYIYPYDVNTKKTYTERPLVFTYSDEDKKFTATTGWSVAAQASTTTRAFLMNDGFLSGSYTITFPAATAISFSGTGTQTDPYQLKTANDLVALSESVAGGNDYEGKYFVVANDIEMTLGNKIYTPIGNIDVPFNGIVDGQGNSITDLTLKCNGASYQGIFGYTGTKFELSNLNVANINISGSGMDLAMIVGVNGGKITNCHANGTINCTGKEAGGICGENDGYVTNCTSEGMITSGGNNGGICGTNYGQIVKCSSTATVYETTTVSTSDHYIGGICGLSLSTAALGIDCKIEDTYFDGQVLDSYGVSICGGIAGMLARTSVKRCFNNGYVYSQGNSNTSYQYAVAGLLGNISDCVIEDCYNAGPVGCGSSINPQVSGLVGYYSAVFSSSTAWVGYLVENASTINNCYNSGFVKSHKDAALPGVIAAYASINNIVSCDGKLTNVYNDDRATGLESGEFATTTEQLTSGTLPAGFSSSVWEAKAGSYPTLKAFAGTEANDLSKANFIMDANDQVLNVKKTITLNAPAGIVWKVLNSETSTFVDETSYAKVEGNKLTIKDEYATAQLAAMEDGASIGRYYVVHLVPSNVFEGEGTSDNPYLIKTVADFEKLNAAVTNHAQTHVGDHFKMANDIDFANQDTYKAVVGFGAPVAFDGEFDGNDKAIHNLKVNGVVYTADGKFDTNASANNVGLFSVIGQKGAVKNLTVANDCKFDVYQQGGAIVGCNLGVIENCRNYAPIDVAFHYGAGIAGINNNQETAKIINCYNAGKIRNAMSIASGICSFNKGEIIGCQNDGDVLGDSIESCPVYAPGKQNTVAAITAYNYGLVDACVNNGTVQGYNTVGGIVAFHTNQYGTAAIKNCINNGVVYCIDNVTSRGAFVASNSYGLGEIANNYYDASVNVNGAVINSKNPGATALSTSEMIAGKAFAGLPEGFTFAAGAYPVRTAFAAEEASKVLSAMYINFQQGENRTNVMKAVALSAAEGQAWSLKQNSAFKIEGSTLNVTVPTELVVVEDTATVVNGNYSKAFVVKTIPAVLAGAGTQEDPFRITCVDDINKLANFMQASGMDYAGYYFRVENDITYTENDEFIPLATGGVFFNGDFDGNNKTIAGFSFTATGSTADNKYKAFFMNVGSNGVIHDLKLNGNICAHSYSAMFAVYNYGVVRNCTNLGTVTSEKSGYMGGIVYRNYAGSLVENCVNEGSVGATGYNYIGGIVNIVDEGSSVVNCTNNGTVMAKLYAGGIAYTCKGSLIKCANIQPITGITGSSNIAGIVYSIATTTVLDSCYNTGDITTTGAYANGIYNTAAAPSTTATTITRGVISNCYNTGNITGAGHSAGIGGKLALQYDVTDCYNTGKVTGVNTSSTYCAGVFGEISCTRSSAHPEFNSTVTRCWNSGDVDCGANDVAGFSGYFSGTECTATDCFNVGNVTSFKNSTAHNVVAGFAGGFAGTAIRCWNAGNVTTDAYGVGGFAGIAGGTVEGIFNVGRIESTITPPSNKYGIVGGLWGYGAAKIHNSFNAGELVGQARVGGITGTVFSGNEIINCYNVGKIITDDKATSSNITRFISTGNETNTVIQNNYWNSDSCTVFENDSIGTGIAMRDLYTADLGDAYTYQEACFPLPNGYADNAIANYAVASVLLAENETADAVMSAFTLGLPYGVTWISSDNITIDGSVARANEMGTGFVTAMANFEKPVKVKATAQDGETADYQKTFNLVLAGVPSGISDIVNSRLVATEYYTVNGIMVKNPERGQIYIVKRIYENGATAVTKQVIR